MRICLTTTSYPPEGTGGIPRQRHILANALVRQGHEVHVITQGQRPETRLQNGVVIHSLPRVEPELLFSEKYPALNYRLTHSLAIQEQVRVLHQERPLDVLDAPLWGLEGFVPIYTDEVPVALWLQTSFGQLVAMGQQSPRPDDLGVIALEKECLRRARGIIADSRTVVEDFEQLYGLRGLQDRSRVVHLGLPDLTAARRSAALDRDVVEALLVGRLEKRKGTPDLFERLPDMLRSAPRLRVRFVGGDNSRWDGFYREHGQTYPEYFHAHWPGLRERVIFEGSVSERRLLDAYRQADLLLVPSLYESFGLIYLEAMRASLPIVTFTSGAAPEIFPGGASDGALIVPAQDSAAFTSAVLALASDRSRREEIGACGRVRFTRSFLDTHMAEQTAGYYQELAGQPNTSSASAPRRIFQVMEALVPGDAVSAIALRNAGLLKQMRASGTILSLHPHPDLPGSSRPVGQFHAAASAALIFHYWNYTYLEDFLRGFLGPKAMHFHNITPPAYFSPGSPGYEATTRGYRQLPEILPLFDLLIGDSTYNLEVLRPYLQSPKPGIVVPPVIEAEAVRARPYDARLLEHLKQQTGIKLLFVGRIARNKRQDRLIELFSALSNTGPAWLYLVGGDQGDPQYRAELEDLRARLPGKERVLFTGKVSDTQLYSYYRAADVFVSASEHEGFGVPLIEAMAFDLPVLAFAAGAVPETLGGAGVLLPEWHSASVAEQVWRMTQEPALRANILEGQRVNLRRFTEAAVLERLFAVVQFLRSGMQDQNLIKMVVG